MVFSLNKVKTIIERVFLSEILLLFLVILISCSEQNNTILTPISTDPDIIIEENNITGVPIIDTSDLYILPKDTGGSHKAYPHKSTTASFGHYLYTPSEYSKDGPKYPLILFLHGWGERGDSSIDPNELNKVLYHGPPKLIKNDDWNPRYPFIVASPQLSFIYWNIEQIHTFIKYLIEHYQINTSRIYITGLSLGGGGSWYYAGAKGDDSYAAAIVPICGSADFGLIENLAKIPVWAFHGANDNIVRAFDNYGSVPMVNAINSLNPEIKAKVTIYPNVGHDSWTRTYDGSGMGKESLGYDQFEMSIYDWMLQYRKE